MADQLPQDILVFNLFRQLRSIVTLTRVEQVCKRWKEAVYLSRDTLALHGFVFRTPEAKQWLLKVLSQAKYLKRVEASLQHHLDALRSVADNLRHLSVALLPSDKSTELAALFSRFHSLESLEFLSGDAWTMLARGPILPTVRRLAIPGLLHGKGFVDILPNLPAIEHVDVVLPEQKPSTYIANDTVYRPLAVSLSFPVASEVLFAVKLGNLGAIRAALDQDPLLGAVVFDARQTGIGLSVHGTLIDFAARYQQQEIVDYLLLHKSTNVNLSLGTTPAVIHAVDSLDSKLLSSLLNPDVEFNVNSRISVENCEVTPLSQLMRLHTQHLMANPVEFHRILKLLLQAGASPCAPVGGWSTLAILADAGTGRPIQRIAKELVKYCYNLRNFSNYIADQLFTLAVERRDADLFDQFAARGLPMTGDRALFASCYNGTTAFAERLYSAGAKLTHPTVVLTHLVRNGGQVAIILLLVQYQRKELDWNCEPLREWFGRMPDQFTRLPQIQTLEALVHHHVLTLEELCETLQGPAEDLVRRTVASRNERLLGFLLKHRVATLSSAVTILETMYEFVHFPSRIGEVWLELVKTLLKSGLSSDDVAQVSRHRRHNAYVAQLLATATTAGALESTLADFPHLEIPVPS